MSADEQLIKAFEGLTASNTRLELAVQEMRLEFQKAFPGGDADGHRRYHEALIGAAEVRKEFWLRMTSELATKGVWGVFIFLLGLLFVAAKAYFHAHP